MRFPTLVITLSLVLVLPVLAQNERVSVSTDIVTVNVAIRDANGRPVTGLTQEQFELFDDEVKQTIEHFSHVSAGVTYGIVYDMHPTTNEQTNAVLGGLREFTRGLTEADDFFLVVFNERGSLVADIIPDRDQLDRHLARPNKREPRSLYDALYLAAGKLRSARNLKRTLLVITDAADHNSQCSFSELRGTLGKLDVQVYGITPDVKMHDSFDYENLTTPTPPSDASPADRAALNSIAMRSGGATFPTSLENRGSISDLLRRASTEMRNYYSLSFYPTAPRDGRWHTLKIRLAKSRASKGFVLTYRLGYQAGKSEL